MTEFHLLIFENIKNPHVDNNLSECLITPINNLITMFIVCLIGFILSIFLKDILKPLGIDGFLILGFPYFGILSILGWLNKDILPVMVPLSIALAVLFIIFWTIRWRISSAVTLIPILGYEFFHYWIVDNFYQAIFMVLVLGIALGGLLVVLSVGANEFCNRWDLEKPGTDGDRCEWCGSSRVKKDIIVGSSYDNYDDHYYCNKCHCHWSSINSSPCHIERRGNITRTVFRIDKHIR